MTLAAPTHVITLLRPRTAVDQDPYDVGADSPEDVLATSVAANVWFPRDRPTQVVDSTQALTVRVLLDPIVGVTPQRGDVLRDQDGLRYRLESATARKGVPGLEHTSGTGTQVTRAAAV